MAYKVLILEPVRDEIAARREAQLKNDPVLREHTFDYLYAAGWAPLAGTQPLPARLRQSQHGLDELELLARLTERVDTRRPDILMVHSGSLFQNYPDQLIFVLQSLKTSHPGLRIGYQPRPFERSLPKPYLEYTAEIGELMSRVFAQGPQMTEPE